MRKAERVVLAIAPDVVMARKALLARGLDPRLPGLATRHATKLYDLRGWSVGTPIVAQDLHDWKSISPEAGRLADAVLALIASGRFRMLQDADVADILGELA